MSDAFRLSIDPEGIGHLVFDLPDEKINKISVPVLEELDTILEGLKDNTQIKVLLITSPKKGIFIAGADLNSFESFFRDYELGKRAVTMGHSVFSKLENLPFPTIAVIDGACLGGGLELALACTYRVVGDGPKTSLGLPETTLGLFPGWGGTQRLPRLVGLTEGLKMILTGKAVNAKKAWKIKLADAILPSEFLEEKVSEFVKECLSEKGKKKILERRKRKGVMTWALERNPVGRALVFWQAEKGVLKKTKGQYPAPLAALDIVRKTFALPLEKGLKYEREKFASAVENELRYATNLIQIFFTSEAIKKDPGVAEVKKPALDVKSVGVIGAGVMGSGIAWLMSYRDIPVRMKDISWEAVSKGYAYAWDTYKTLMKIRKLKPNEANRKFHQLAGTVDYTGFKKLDLVIEAAVENIDLKHKILEEIEGAVRSDALIATNTSSLTVQELADKMKHPERFLGMHFFNPPARMPLVEIVAGEKTSPEAIATAVEFCKKLKKTPIVVKDCSGFLVNRVFARGFVEIMRMLEEGVEMERLEKLFLKFGLPMGPFVLADEIGNDVNLKAFRGFEHAYGDRMHMPELLTEVNARELYGKKVGKGFYLYKNKKKTPNPEIAKILGEKVKSIEISDEEIIDRSVLAMINEAALCLEEGVVANPRYLDLALIYGIGFPPFRGGLLRYSDTRGAKSIVSKLKQFQLVYGDRYKPAELLLEKERENKGFY